MAGSQLQAVNAALNGASAVFIVLGFLVIRRGRVQLHKACMIAAVILSGVFLACYLYYHFVVRGGEPTPFPGEGSVRLLYLVVLGSHTLLAMVAAPLVLITARLGLSNRLSGHVRLARWTLPIWLYVSLTGVLVYWMLYHLYPPE